MEVFLITSKSDRGIFADIKSEITYWPVLTLDVLLL